MIGFESPWWLLGLIPVAVVATAYLWRQRRRRGDAVRFSTTELLREIAPTGLGWRRHLPAAAFLLTLVALVGALARPTVERAEPVEQATVILAIDVSLSMDADDVAPTRLAAAQQAAIDFIRGLPSDHQLGLVSFAGTATVLVAPTTDRQAAQRAVQGLQLAEATATGEAVFASLEAIRSVREQQPEFADVPARILLLSDGYRTAGRPTTAASAAAVHAGVPVFTVAFGTDEGMIDLAGQWHRVPVDRRAMAQLAEATGGRFYEAATAQELADVYRDMGSIVAYRTVPQPVTQVFLAAALLLGLVAAALSLRWTPRLP